MNAILPMIVPSAGEALETLRLAHSLNLSASYHPVGGETLRDYVPVTHTVHVEGDPDSLRKFLKLFEGDRPCHNKATSATSTSPN